MDVPVQSVKKAFDLLIMLAFEDLARQGVTLTELAGRMDMPTNTAHNLLKTMAACGFVAQTETGKYIAGPRCQEMGRINHILSGSAAQVIPQRLEALSRRLGEAVTFAILCNGRRTRLWQADSNQVLRVNQSALETRSIYAMPTGRVLLAYADTDERTLILQHYGLPGPLWDDIRSERQLEAASATIREQGHCAIIPDGELASFACAVLDREGHMLGALGCYAPLYRCPKNKHAALVAQLKQTAQELSASV